MLLCNHISE
ncbi:hypothetical protein NXF25_009370 [Crotalus adamanteus]|uniref:Uncharacterized protein n=1 Tax=Crotalus adamanteus TaxID=8729 RepID=A0AAW1BRK9_CROAD